MVYAFGRDLFRLHPVFRFAAPCLGCQSFLRKWHIGCFTIILRKDIRYRDIQFWVCNLEIDGVALPRSVRAHDDANSRISHYGDMDAQQVRPLYLSQAISQQRITGSLGMNHTLRCVVVDVVVEGVVVEGGLLGCEMKRLHIRSTRFYPP
jgi:hypothetical protein